MSIIVKLPFNDGGFFCQIWKLMSKYILSKKYNTKFYLDDTEWLFRHSNGWKDYFTTLEIITPSTKIPEPIFFDIDEHYTNQFTLNEYRNAFKEIFQFNDTLKEKLQNTIKELNLDEYDAIMIRRGDKMYGESEYISTEKYVEKLLEKNSKTIFVQTDDYKAYEEVCEIVKDKDIRVLTTCPKNKFGCFVFNYAPEVGSTLTKENDNYLKELAKLAKKKSVNQYNSSEMKEHVEEMLIGLEICLKSRYLVTDYQSNVTRYLVVNHQHPNNVINIGKEENLNFDIPMKCPTYGFIVSS